MNNVKFETWMPKVGPINVLTFTKKDFNFLVKNAELYKIDKALQGITTKELNGKDTYVVVCGSEVPAVGKLLDFEKIYYRIYSTGLSTEVIKEPLFKHETDSQDIPSSSENQESGAELEN